MSGGIANDTFTDNSFYSSPEFGIYLNNSSTLDSSLGLNFNQSKILLNRNVTGEASISSTARAQSLLNPDNIHELFLDFTYKRYDTIRKRFLLTSNDQVMALHAYLLDMIEKFLQQDEEYIAVAYAQILQRTMSNSWHDIDRVLPLELAARSIAYQVASNNYTCEDFMAQVPDYTMGDTICKRYNMTIPNKAKLYINATWYGANSTYTQYFS